MLKNLKYVLGAIWLAVVIFFYYKNHSYYLNENSNPSFSGLIKYWEIWLAPLAIYGAFLFMSWFNGKNEVTLRINTKKILSFFFLSMLFVGNVAFWKLKPLMYTGPAVSISQSGETFFEPDQTTIQSNPYYFVPGVTISNEFNFYENSPQAIKENLVKASFLQIETGLVWTFVKIYGVSLLFLLFALNLGNSILKKVRKEEDFETNVLDMVLGLGVSTGILLLLALLGQFKLIFIIPLFLLLSGILWKNLLRLIKRIWSFEVEYEFKFSNLLIPAFLVFWIFLCLNLFDNLSPMPRGWDGLNRYVLLARDIAEGHSALKIGSVYAWELVLALGYAIDAKLALFWTAMPVVLTLLLIYLLCRKFTSRSSSMLAIATLIAAPIMIFYLADENKIDPAHWMFGTAALVAFLNYPKNSKSIYLAGLFAGFAFTVKFTSVFLVLALLSAFAFTEGGFLSFGAALLVGLTVLALQGGFNLGTEFISSPQFNKLFAIASSASAALLLGIGTLKKKINKASIKKLFILIAMILLPILPWFAKNLSETHSVSISSLLQGKNEIFQPDFETLKSCGATSFYEEYDRYLGYDSNILVRVFELPWHLTMNDQGARGTYVDLGFAFLGFALLAILLTKRRAQNLHVVLFGASLTLFWLLKSYGVIWYGFTILSFLALMLATCFENIRKDIFGKIILGIFFVIWIFTAMNVKLMNFGNAPLMLSHTGVISYDQVREAIFPYSNELQEFLEQNEGNVYKVGTPLGFFIPNLAQRSFDDQLLDRFNCLYQIHEEDFSQVAADLRSKNIKYVLYDSYTKTVGMDPKGTLANKVSLIEEFLNNYSIPVIYDNIRGYHLYYIPSPEELAEFRKN